MYPTHTPLPLEFYCIFWRFSKMTQMNLEKSGIPDKSGRFSYLYFHAFSYFTTCIFVLYLYQFFFFCQYQFARCDFHFAKYKHLLHNGPMSVVYIVVHNRGNGKSHIPRSEKSDRPVNGYFFKLPVMSSVIISRLNWFLSIRIICDPVSTH